MSIACSLRDAAHAGRYAMMAAQPAWRLSSVNPAPRYRDHALGSRLFLSLPTGETMAVRPSSAQTFRAGPAMMALAAGLTMRWYDHRGLRA